MTDTLAFGVGRTNQVDHAAAQLVGSPASFWPIALPYAQQVYKATKVLVSVSLAQWAIETGYGGVDWQPPRNNPGNVGNFSAGGQLDFPTLQAGVDADINTMLLGYYTGVRNGIGWYNQSLALGQSPWAGAHYELPGSYPGSELIWVIQNYNLTQYDSEAPLPPNPLPVPTPVTSTSKETNMLAKNTGGQGYWGVRPNASVYTFEGATYIGPHATWSASWGIGTATNPVVGIAADGKGGFALLCDGADPSQPHIYDIPADGQYASPKP